MTYLVSPFGYFLFGAISTASVVVGLFFWKYYLRTKDRLLLYFGVSFFMMAVERMLLASMMDPAQGEARSWVYVIRLFSFSLIIYGIYEKNRVPRRTAPRTDVPAPRAH